MKRRNWLDLSRKLVDRYDLNDTLGYIQSSLGQEALAYWGEGVLTTKLYPKPFAITLSGTSLGGTVGPGIAYDPTGQIIQNDANVPFTVVSDPTNSTWSLLVARYKMTGDTPVPKPSDPISTVFLNLHDDFDIVVIPGTQAATPSYPVKLPSDVILAGLQIPAAATLGTQVVIDLTIQEQGSVSANRVSVDPTAFQISKQSSLQGELGVLDSFLLLGALNVASDNAVHDNAFITCNSGGTPGDSVTIAGVPFVIGTNAALGQIPPQPSGSTLGFALARAIREWPSFSGLYTAVASSGNVALYAIQTGSVGGTLSVSGGTFSVSKPALSGNGPRRILTLPGLATQLDLADFYMSTLVPPSTVIWKAGPNMPSGWLYCDGSAVSRTTFVALFNEIGTTYGAGDGSTTFNIPDARGRSPLSEGSGPGLSTRFLGQAFGEESHSLSQAELPYHDHGGGNHAHSIYDPGHIHPINVGAGLATGIPFVASGNSTIGGANVSVTYYEGTGIGINNSGNVIGGVGSNVAHNNMQPSLVLKAFIKF